MDKNRSLGIEQKFKVMRAKSYRCERDLRAAESKISKQTQVKFHYAAERNFILGKWLLERNKNSADKILRAGIVYQKTRHNWQNCVNKILVSERR